jgi:hypothetical protein
MNGKPPKSDSRTIHRRTSAERRCSKSGERRTRSRSGTRQLSVSWSAGELLSKKLCQPSLTSLIFGELSANLRPDAVVTVESAPERVHGMTQIHSCFLESSLFRLRDHQHTYSLRGKAGFGINVLKEEQRSFQSFRKWTSLAEEEQLNVAFTDAGKYSVLDNVVQCRIAFDAHRRGPHDRRGQVLSATLWRPPYSRVHSVAALIHNFQFISM